MTDTSKAPELLPCPFCEGEAEISQYGDRRKSTQYQCLECGCNLETGEEWGHGGHWNTRPTPTVQQAAKVLLDNYQYVWPDEACDAISDNVDGTTAYQLSMALRAIAEQGQDA